VVQPRVNLHVPLGGKLGGPTKRYHSKSCKRFLTSERDVNQDNQIFHPVPSLRPLSVDHPSLPKVVNMCSGSGATTSLLEPPKVEN